MAEYKLTFGDRVITYDDWNGYISYQLPHNVILTQQPGGIITAEPMYIAGTLIGYATMNADMINCKNIGLLKEQSSGTNSHIKNIRVAGFSTLADAQAYNG